MCLDFSGFVPQFCGIYNNVRRYLNSIEFRENHKDGLRNGTLWVSQKLQPCNLVSYIKIKLLLKLIKVPVKFA